MVSGTDLVALSDEELADALEEDQTARGASSLESVFGVEVNVGTLFKKPWPYNPTV